MKYGYIRTAAATTNVKVADCKFNSLNIVEAIRKAYNKNTELIVFPELCITGYTCGDLFLQTTLLEEAENQLLYIVNETKNLEIVSVVGLPIEFEGKLYNCGAVIYKGNILGIVPKTSIPNYNEFYEARIFTEAFEGIKNITINEKKIPFGTKILFKCDTKKHFSFAVEICEDLWITIPPSSFHACAGAYIIANPSAGNEITGKDIYRKNLVSNQSARLLSGYIYSCAGAGESTTDVVFSGHNIICENGKVISESERFKNSIIYSDIDVMYLNEERRRNSSFKSNSEGYIVVNFDMNENNCDIERFIDPHPFIPYEEKQRDKRCIEIMNIQAYGLKKRIEHIGCKHIVIGISGGLDSTHALIIANKAFKLLGLDSKGIITVTMPCFGTTGRTYNNALKLCKLLKTTIIEINIKNAVISHFKDIGQDINNHNLTYENSQARERTQILMDISNKYNGFVVGTGDLSELALGFATYNGDHMSMYGVNASVPKTLIRYLIKYEAENSEDEKFKMTLLDILDTPVSPELLPPKDNGNINQVTEDIVGPYELHDFFLYNVVRMGFPPDKIYYLAKIAFKDVFDDITILKWLKTFYKRFFAQQYKRSCLPDGPKVGSVSLSPRGDFRMPSDACAKIWLDKIENM